MSELKPKANKKLGQHYLNNTNTIKNICADFNGQYDLILEIGPGPATLTKFLVEKKHPVVLIEKDERFVEMLNALNPAPQIFHVDALEFDVEQMLQELNSQHTWLVSNLPYNVGTPIMIKYMQVPQIKYLTLMFQKEVAQKVHLPLFGEKKMKKEMNSLHALVNNYFEISLLQKVPPGQFSPPPKVDSAVISLKKRNNPIIAWSEFNQYEEFLRKLFSNRRKQLGSVLKNFFDKDIVVKVFENLNIENSRRSETLTFSEVVDIYQNLIKG